MLSVDCIEWIGDSYPTYLAYIGGGCGDLADVMDQQPNLDDQIWTQNWPDWPQMGQI